MGISFKFQCSETFLKYNLHNQFFTDCLADRAKLYDDNSSTTSSSNSSIGVSKIKQVSNKQVSKKYQSDIKSASNYSSIKSKFENFDSGLSSKHSSVKSLKSVVSQKPVISSSRSSSISSSRNSPANSDSNSISNTNIQNSSQNSSINSSRSSPNNELVSRIKDDSKLFGDSAISIDTDDLPLPPPPPKPEANEFMNSAFLPPPGPVFNKSRPLIAPKPAKLGSLRKSLQIGDSVQANRKFLMLLLEQSKDANIEI